MTAREEARDRALERIEKLPFVCTWCGDKFATPEQLKAHRGRLRACGANANVASGMRPDAVTFGTPSVKPGSDVLRLVRENTSDAEVRDRQPGPDGGVLRLREEP